MGEKARYGQILIFANPHGLDHGDLYTTPYDIALLGQALASVIYLQFTRCTVKNHLLISLTLPNVIANGLLNDPSMNVDGMKTGYTSGAIYSLTSSKSD